MKKFRIILCFFLVLLTFSLVFSTFACKKNVLLVENYDELLNAINSDGEVIKLSKDIFSTESIYISRRVTLDLNGKTLSASGYDGVINAGENAILTIKGNGKIIANENQGYAMAVWANKNAKVIIEDGTFSQNISGSDEQYDMIYASGTAEITILGGTFNCKTPQWTLTVYDKDGLNAKFAVSGGKFREYDPSGSLTESKNDSVGFVADGYKVKYDEKTKYYSVVEK